MPICGLFRLPGKVPQLQADESSPRVPSPYSVLIGRRRWVSAVTTHQGQGWGGQCLGRGGGGAVASGPLYQCRWHWARVPSGTARSYTE